MMRSLQPRFHYFYLVCVVFGGILTHLVSEFAGLGAAAERFVFSPRHAYLALAAIAAAVLALREFQMLRRNAHGERDFKRLISLALQAPLLRGWRLYGATAALQCGVGIASAFGEGCFFCGHDVFAAVVGAIFSALLLAIVGRALAVRLPSLASDFIQFLRAIAVSGARVFACRLSFNVVFNRFFWFNALFNRPPPALQS